MLLRMVCNFILNYSTYAHCKTNCFIKVYNKSYIFVWFGTEYVSFKNFEFGPHLKILKIIFVAFEKVFFSAAVKKMLRPLCEKFRQCPAIRKISFAAAMPKITIATTIRQKCVEHSIAIRPQKFFV